ncbi:MAG: hypothetical protein ACP5UH_03525 [Candidatus Micrarchaeia archaeon]
MTTGFKSIDIRYMQQDLEKAAKGIIERINDMFDTKRDFSAIFKFLNGELLPLEEMNAEARKREINEKYDKRIQKLGSEASGIDKRKKLEEKRDQLLKAVDAEVESIRNAVSSMSESGINFSGKGLIEHESGVKSVQDIFNRFIQVYGIYLETGDINGFHKHVDEFAKYSVIPAHKVPDELAEIGSFLKSTNGDIQRYVSLLKGMFDSSYLDEFKVWLKEHQGANIDKYRNEVKNRIKTEMGGISNVMDKTQKGAATLLFDFIMLRIMVDISDEISEKGSFMAGVEFYNKKRSNPDAYVAELVKKAVDVGIVAPKKSAPSEGATAKAYGGVQEQREGPKFAIDGNKRVDRNWVKDARAYWEQLKKENGASSESIDRMLSSIENNNDATVVEAFGAWKEINKVWLQKQQTLDPKDAEMLLKRSESAVSMEELEVLWRIELAMFAQRRRSDFMFSDEELERMQNKINAKDGTYWGELYYRMLKRLQELEEERIVAQKKVSQVPPLEVPKEKTPEVQTANVSRSQLPPPPPTS